MAREEEGAQTASNLRRSPTWRIAGQDHDLDGHVLISHLQCRYEKEFEQVQDVFELQRNLNNAFAYDLVPSPSVIIAALRAARRVNDFPTAVRVFEGRQDIH